MSLIDFAEAKIPDFVPDSVPPTSDVEYPCGNCGREAGPYGGRGPKPKFCTDCKPKRQSKTNVKVSGATANRTAQAAGVLEQLNGMIALGLMAVGMNQSAHALAAANEGFKEQAYLALSTDDELCKLILKGGGKSAKVSLALAYGMLGVAVVPVAVAEAKEKKAARDLAREEYERETGTEN